MQSARKALIEVCRRLYDRFYLVATDGNVSMRLSEARILTTPTGTNKGFLTVDDLVTCDMEGRAIGGGKPSTEIAMHLEVYRLRPEVEAVVHGHPPFATSFAAAGKALDVPLLTESVCGLGAVPLAPFSLPSTQEVPASLRPLIPRCSAILLQSHGVITYGKSLMDAYNKMESVEQYARVQLLVDQLGGGRIPAPQVERLLALRGRYGLTEPVIPPA